MRSMPATGSSSTISGCIASRTSEDDLVPAAVRRMDPAVPRQRVHRRGPDRTAARARRDQQLSRRRIDRVGAPLAVRMHLAPAPLVTAARVEPRRLDLADEAIAQAVLALQRESYAVEAALIGDERIPMLTEIARGPARGRPRLAGCVRRGRTDRSRSRGRSSPTGPSTSIGWSWHPGRSGEVSRAPCSTRSTARIRVDAWWCRRVARTSRLISLYRRRGFSVGLRARGHPRAVRDRARTGGELGLGSAEALELARAVELDECLAPAAGADLSIGHDGVARQRPSVSHPTGRARLRRWPVRHG